MEMEYTADTPRQLKESKHALQLLTENTPNGKKVQILLEELHDAYGTSWATHLIDLETDEQKKSWFLRLNPNGRIPVLLDRSEGGSVISIMESQAILTYLQENYDQNNLFGFTSASERSQVMQWLFFWHSSAPVQGHGRHFIKGGPRAYTFETCRCGRVLPKGNAPHIFRARSPSQRTAWGIRNASRISSR
ncbi:uncharacterized protein TrAtP1_003238 [Trichoderma atroviride]|uniref:uncharacterized protein n=1 Tax=Hypocrea atroviridis TaxID=63577 RepID=UPI003319EC1C|nr:hypothetical protein TrAtP1_003238 [Trichoderma atroviride]